MSYLNQTKLETKSLGSDSYFINYNKKLNSYEFRETSETEYSSNKNYSQSSLENSSHTEINELNSELALASNQFIYIKKSLQELNDLYQRNENTSTYTNVLINQLDDLKEENKIKNRIIQSLVEQSIAVFWQTKGQNVEIENTPYKMFIISNLEKTAYMPF